MSAAPQQDQLHSDPSMRPATRFDSLRALRVSAIVLATIASVWALQWGAPFFIPCAVAICVTFWLVPVVDRLQAWRVPRSVGAAVVLLALIGGLGFTGYALRDDARGFAASLPAATRNARMILNEVARDRNGLIHHIRDALSDRPVAGGRARVPDPVQNSVDVQAALWRGSTTAMIAAANVIVVLFAIYLMLLSGDLFKRKLMVVVSNQAESGNLTRKRVTVDILNEIASQFQRYLGVLAVTNIVIGLLTWGAFAALGVEHAAVWGAAAAVLHIVPYVGPAVITVAAFLVAGLQFDSLSQALLVASTVLLIFGLIGMLFSTWLAGRAANMNAVAVFLGLMFWGWLWGISGLLLGTPLVMAMKVIADRVECLHWLGTLLGDAPKRERKVAVETDDRAASALAASAVTEGLAESASQSVLGAPASIAGEIAAENMAVTNSARHNAIDCATNNGNGNDKEAERESKLFGASPFPA